MSALDDARRIIENAITGGIFPAAAADAGSSRGSLWHEAFGTLAFTPDAPPATLSTPFDLASLTKPLATTTAIMELVHAGALRLDEPLHQLLPEWRGDDRETVTIQDLLEHASGLSARLLDAPPQTAREFEHEICTMRLEYPPRSRSIYSDLGFILLGLIVTRRAGRPLGTMFQSLVDRLASLEPALAREPLTYTLPDDARRLTAPTRPLSDDPRQGRTLVGEVHDHYAENLGLEAGHAGLFGTAGSVAAFARIVLRAVLGDSGMPAPFTPPLTARFIRRTTVAGSSQALGWDTMLVTSSCGTHLSPSAFGHVGFTGTSLWIDPGRDRYFVLLTNTVNGGGSREQLRLVRRAFHDALSDL